jgi:hypothetical protein
MRYVFGTWLILSMALVMGVCIGAHASDEDVPQIAIVLTYSGGKLADAEVMGTTDTVESCQRSIAAFLATIATKPDVEMTGVCTPLPPPPAVRKQEPAERL